MHPDNEFTKILETLSKHSDGLSLGEICAETHLSKGTVIKHMKLLVGMGLVEIKLQGNQTIYKSCIQDPKSVPEGIFFTELCGMFLRRYIRPLNLQSCDDLLESCFSVAKLGMEITNAYCILDPDNTELCLPESLKIVANYALGFLSEVSTSINGNRRTLLRFYRKRLYDILTRCQKQYVYLEIMTEDHVRMRGIKTAYSGFRRPKNSYPYSKKELRVICELLLRKKMTWTQLRTRAELSNAGLKNIPDKLLDKAVKREILMEEAITKLYTIDFHGLMEDLLEKSREKLRKMKNIPRSNTKTATLFTITLVRIVALEDTA